MLSYIYPYYTNCKYTQQEDKGAVILNDETEQKILDETIWTGKYVHIIILHGADTPLLNELLLS